MVALEHELFKRMSRDFSCHPRGDPARVQPLQVLYPRCRPALRQWHEDEGWMYGLHHSSPSTVMLFLLRRTPDAFLHLQFGRFGAPDRLFHSVEAPWRSSLESHTDVKELVPDFYNTSEEVGEFLVNSEALVLGTAQDGSRVNNVTRLPWAADSRDFVAQWHAALESPIATASLPSGSTCCSAVRYRSSPPRPWRRPTSFTRSPTRIIWSGYCRTKRIGLVRELSPQRDVGRPPALLVAAAGLAVALRRPWRCGGAARVGGPQDVWAGRQAAAGWSWAGAWCLSARSPACAARVLPSLDGARCVARRRFSRLPLDMSTQAAPYLFEACDSGGSWRCVPVSARCTRTPA